LTPPTKTSRAERRWPDAELTASATMLALMLVIGLATVRDYGITIDEFLFDDFGRKMLDWYRGGFAATPHYDDETIVFYGPWFQVLVSIAQSLLPGHRFDVRHATTFLIGWAGLAALVPIGRLAIGRWAGLAALVLCLLTGNLYGHLFFSPNDVPFMATMNFAVLAILIMARREPSWPATVCTGLLTGLAIATRVGGLLTQLYLIVAMALLGAELVLADRRGSWRALVRIGAHTTVALLIGWVATFALWPWVQTAHPLTRFREALARFSKVDLDFPFPHWGRAVSSAALPWDYLPGQLLARLPEGLVILLVIALGFAAVEAGSFIAAWGQRTGHDGASGRKTAVLRAAQSRGLLVIAMAAVAPIAAFILTRPTIFDGIRHFLFVIPMLALLGAWALWRLAPLIRRFPIASGVIATAQVVALIVTLCRLHPLEYIATNALTGGTAGAYGRFDLDYWCAAATEAIRRLEARLAADPGGPFAVRPPRVLVCIPWREYLVAPMFRQNWSVATDAGEADFVIETERSHCAKGGELIDEVRRFDRAFAWTFANPSARQ
jgi:hypothetical protein